MHQRCECFLPNMHSLCPPFPGSPHCICRSRPKTCTEFTAGRLVLWRSCVVTTSSHPSITQHKTGRCASCYMSDGRQSHHQQLGSSSSWQSGHPVHGFNEHGRGRAGPLLSCSMRFADVWRLLTADKSGHVQTSPGDLIM